MPRPKKTPPNHGQYYEHKITVGNTIEGAPIRKSFYSTVSLEDAKAKAEEYKLKNAVSEVTGIPIINRVVLFQEYSAKLLEIKKSTVKPYTYSTTYETKVRKYIDPYFGKYDIKSIKPYMIQKFFAKHSKLSESMHDKFHLILVSIFDMAIDNDDCYKNPAKKVTPGGVKPKVRPTYNDEQEKKIFDYCLKNNVVDIAILIDSGIRRSEMLGLRWDTDINYKDKYITVDEAVTPSDKGPAIIDLPKSETSRRAIPVSPELIDMLERCKGQGYILKGRNGDYMSPSGYAKNIRKRMDEICAKLGIPRLTPHELRHTFGTLQHESGTDIYTLSRVMGHADVQITSKTYVHDRLDAIRNNMHIRSQNDKAVEKGTEKQ